MKLNKYVVFTIIGVLVILLDQITKMYIHTEINYGATHVIVPDFFNITYVRNTGAAFGIFRDSNETFRNIFFLAIPPVAVLIILGYLKATPDWDRIQIWALAGIAGGALGNYVDRIKYGWVIDFLDFHFKGHHYPSFNVADSAIVVGVSILFLLTLRDMRREKEQSKKEQTL